MCRVIAVSNQKGGVPVDSISTRHPLRSVSPISQQESWYSARMNVLST